MNEIIKIEINIESLSNSFSILIVPNALKAYKSGNEIDIKQDFVKKLLSIICTWGNNNVSNNVIDPLTYEVTVYIKDNKIDRYYGKGKYPYNFTEFMDLLGDLDG